MFWNNKRLEEDLERIRQANLPPEKLAAEQAARKSDEDDIKEKLKDTGAREIFVMMIAALSIILPYIGMIAVMLLAFWFVIRLMAG